MARFTLPRDLYHGENALEALKTLDGKRAIVVVGGGSMKRFGFLDKVCDYLKPVSYTHLFFTVLYFCSKPSYAPIYPECVFSCGYFSE